MTNPNFLRHLFRDFLIVVGSVIIAFLLVKEGVIQNFIEATSGSIIISSVIAGAFFTSIFTIAPAVVGLIAIGESSSPLFVAFFAAFGAMGVDFIITSFIRKDISEDLESLSNMAIRRHIIKAFHFGFLKWFAFILGLIFISTPLPDEFGLFLVGVSKVKTWALPLILYTAHFIGIFIVLSIAASV